MEEGEHITCPHASQASTFTQGPMGNQHKHVSEEGVSIIINVASLNSQY